MRDDIIFTGKKIIGRALTEVEINELTEAMKGRYSWYQETYTNKEDIDVLFDENFYDELEENIKEMLEGKLVNNFECRLLLNDGNCDTPTKQECWGVLCPHYNLCSWCESKDCEYCKNNKQYSKIGRNG